MDLTSLVVTVAKLCRGSQLIETEVIHVCCSMPGILGVICFTAINNQYIVIIKKFMLVTMFITMTHDKTFTPNCYDHRVNCPALCHYFKDQRRAKL